MKISEIESLFKLVSNGEFTIWLDTKLPSLDLRTPRDLIDNNEEDKVIDLLCRFINKK